MTVTYLLDTNTVSYIAKGKSPAARARLEALREDEAVCISSITEAEIRYGLARRPDARALRAAVEAQCLLAPRFSVGMGIVSAKIAMSPVGTVYRFKARL